MSELSQAAETVQTFAKQYRALMAISAALGKAGSLEDHINELIRLIEKAINDKAVADEATQLAQKQLADIQEQVREARALIAKTDELKNKAANEVVEYKKELMAQAEADADVLIKEANRQVVEMIDGAKKEVKLAQDAAKIARNDEAATKVRLEDLKKQIADLRARF